MPLRFDPAWRRLATNTLDGSGDDSGYIADMLYHVPANTPTTDLPVFIRDVPP